MGFIKKKFNLDLLFIAVQWEADCDFAEATFQQFVDWLEGTARDDNGLRQYNPALYWCYADYKYMKELFCDHPDLIKVDLSVLYKSIITCSQFLHHLFF